MLIMKLFFRLKWVHSLLFGFAMFAFGKNWPWIVEYKCPSYVSWNCIFPLKSLKVLIHLVLKLMSASFGDFVLITKLFCENDVLFIHLNQFV